MINLSKMRSIVIGTLALAFWTSAVFADELAVITTSPQPSQPVFGEVRLAADILGRDDGQIESVEFFVDDTFIGRRNEPPWEVFHDVGGANTAHRFEIVAIATDGARASSLLVSRQIRVDLELDASLQQLYVTVERRGQRVTDLQRGDFTVLDDGARQQLVTFERGDVPLAAILLVDASSSMYGERLDAALAGARAFVDGMAALDQAQLLLFSDRVIHQTPFTNIGDILAAGLQTVEASGSTALNDHLYASIMRLAPLQGRRVVIMLSDGIDVASFMDMSETLEAVRRSQSLIYWLRLGSSLRSNTYVSAWRDAEQHRNQIDFLEQAIEVSGGRIVELTSIHGASAAFESILEELRGQYVLGYYPTEDHDDGRWHELKVDVARRGLDIRLREGYVDR